MMDEREVKSFMKTEIAIVCQLYDKLNTKEMMKEWEN